MLPSLQNQAFGGLQVQRIHWRDKLQRVSECCDAAKSVWKRAMLSCRSRAAYYNVLAKQTLEQLQAAKGRRPAVLLALVTFELELPEGWEQDPPPRLEMCRRCAELVEQVGGHCGWSECVF
jgi:hypothetical protein